MLHWRDVRDVDVVSLDEPGQGIGNVGRKRDQVGNQMASDQERIIVGVDGSPASIDALKWARGQASLTGAALEAVIAWQYPAMLVGYPMAAEVDWPSNAHQVLDTALAEAFGADSNQVSSTVVEGHPAKALIDAAVGAALLVVGNRGHGGFAGMLLGSVSEQVAAHAHCPVLVIRHSPDADPEARET